MRIIPLHLFDSMKTITAILVALCCAGAVGVSAQSTYTAYNLPTFALGNEESGEYPIGNDFRVVQPLRVTHPGMFNSNSDVTDRQLKTDFPISPITRS